MTSELWTAAVEVLRENDLGGWTKPAPRLYPYQWSWDSAFIAIGLVHVDPRAPCASSRRCSTRSGPTVACRTSCSTTKRPTQDYFPDPGWWASQKFSPPAPAEHADQRTGPAAGPRDRGLAHRPGGWRQRARPACAELYPRLVAWHRYLVDAPRPRWARAHRRLPPLGEHGQLAPIRRPAGARRGRRAAAVYTPRHRAHSGQVATPTDAEYDRFLWLVNLLKACRYDDTADPAHAAAAGAGRLLQRHLRRRQPRAVAAGRLAWSRVGSAGARRSGPRAFRTPSSGSGMPTERLALDYDVRADAPIRVQTYAGFAPLLVPDLEPGLRDQLVDGAVRSALRWRRGIQVPADPERCAGLARLPAPQLLARTGLAGR